MASRLRVGQCSGCLGWGTLVQPPYCSPCHQWRSKPVNEIEICRRCRFSAVLGPDQLCRGCVLAVKEFDAEFYFAPDDRGRDVQLTLIVPRLPRHAKPIGRYRKRSDGRFHPPSWARHQRPVQVLDDPRICPRVIPDQLLLIRVRRELTDEHAQRIKNRDFADGPLLQSAVDAYAVERGLTQGWKRWIKPMVLLALAVTEADGHRLIQRAALEDLPHAPDVVAELTRRAGLLDARPAPLEERKMRRGPWPRLLIAERGLRRSCPECGCWGLQRVCVGCRKSHRYRPGTCVRCGRAEIPILSGRCRACRIHVAAHGSTGTEIQLWIDGPWGAATLPAVQPARPPTSSHLLVPGQQVLFGVGRDWRPALEMTELPAPTPAAADVLRRFDELATRQKWKRDTYQANELGIRVLLCWLGAEAPVPEADVHALPRAWSALKVRRVLTFLNDVGLLELDPRRQREPLGHQVHRRLRQYPGQIGEELRRWVAVLRGQGRIRHSAVPYRTIYNYLGYAAPVLAQWRGRVSSLREITREDVMEAVKAYRGEEAHRLMVALRSIFRALKQERLVFTNPTAGISITRRPPLPVTLQPDQIAGLLDRINRPVARLSVVLVALHGLQVADLRRILLTDFNLSRGRLTVSRSAGKWTVYLDQLTLDVLDAWLRERHRRWPTTPNPHLLISQQTAVDLSPVGAHFVSRCFGPVGVAPSKLRPDRILDEAKHTADPVHLMRVFGISDATAMKYVYTAHPERQSRLPR